MNASVRLGSLALLLLLGFAAPASAGEVGALLVEPGDPLIEQLDPARFNIRPLKDAYLLLAPGSEHWPPGTPFVRSSARRQLYLFEARRSPGLPPIDGVELLQSVGSYLLVGSDPSAAQALLQQLHGEGLRWIERRPPARSLMADAAKGSVDPGIKSALIEAVDTSKFQDHVAVLAGAASFQLGEQVQMQTIPERYTGRPGVDLAADYLEDRLSSWGYTVVRQDFLAPDPGGFPAQNVLAIKTGTASPEEIIVVGAHYDSIALDAPATGPAPGAEDNGSGTAAVLHLAELFARYATERTIHFVLFGGEEQGLWGSKHYVANSSGVIAALTMDMMSAHQSIYGIDIEGWADGDPCNCWPLMQQFETEINAASPSLATRYYYPGFGSDHVPFRNAQIPVLLAIESDYDFYPGYHKTTDTVEKLDYTFGSLVVRGMAAMLAELSVPTGRVSVLLSGFEVEATKDGVRLDWQLQSDESGQLRIDRSEGDAAFAALPGARWSLGEDPGVFLDRQAASRRLRYRLVLETPGREETLAQRELELRASATFGLRLHPAEPNPFSAAAGTTLRFDLPRAASVSLDVYDAAGRHVRRLLEGQRDAGPQSVHWDGRDKQGHGLASGIYFVRLTGGLEQETRRLALLGGTR